MVLFCFPLLLIEEISFKPENFPDVKYEVGIKVNFFSPQKWIFGCSALFK